MHFFVQRSDHCDLYDKVVAQRISEADALCFFETKDINALGAMANRAASV